MTKSTIETLFREQARAGSHRAALREKRGGVWVTTTWGQWWARSRAIAASLVDAGVGLGDRVAILARTRQAWVEADMGIVLAGAVTVPIYPTLTPDQAAYVLADSGARVLFVDDPIALERVSAGVPSSAVASLLEVVMFDTRSMRAEPDEEGRRVLDLADAAARCPARVRSLADAIARGTERLAGSADRTLEERALAIEPSSLASVMYTSGTTGPPRGAMLTHDNFVFEVQALEGLMGLGPHDEQLLFLPMAHVFARILEMAALRVGFVTAFAESIFTAPDDLTEISPTFFGSVPRLFEKIHIAARHRASMEGEIRRRLFDWATGVGVEVARRRRGGLPVSTALALKHRYADRHVLSRIRAVFGKRFRFALSGGAPLSTELGEWFHGCGVTILEGYGLTGTTSATHVNLPGSPSFGSVGPALPGVEVKLGGDGEVCVRGRNVTRGYWRSPEATAEAFDADGFFHTGDIGVIDAEGALTITDRKKDILVTSGGKNIAPQNIETLLQQSRWISHAVVFGDRRKHLVALLTLETGAIVRWARERDRDADPASLARDPEVRGLLWAEVRAANGKLAQHETIKSFAVLDRDLTAETGELTPTLKVRRRAVYEKHRALIDGLYDDEA